MHKKMLSILLLVGALGLATANTSLAGASTTDFVYDVGGGGTAPGAKALHEGASGGNTVESIGIATGSANLGSGGSPAFFTAVTEDVSIGSSTGSSLGDWTLATVGAPTGALTVTNITSSVANNVWVNLNLGGVGIVSARLVAPAKTSPFQSGPLRVT